MGCLSGCCTGYTYWLLVPEHGSLVGISLLARVDGIYDTLVDVCLWMSLILLLAPLAYRPRSATVTSTHARLLYVLLLPSLTSIIRHRTLSPLPFANWYFSGCCRLLVLHSITLSIFTHPFAAATASSFKTKRN